MHYLTEEPEKIIGAIRRQEKKAIKEYAEAVKIRDAFVQIDNENSRLMLQVMKPVPETITKAFVMAIVKRWTGVLSTYMLLEDDFNLEGGILSGIGFIHYPKHIAQKYAALLVFENEKEIECELWRKGEVIGRWSHCTNSGMKFGEHNVSFSDIGNGEMCDKWIEFAPTGINKNNLTGIPLLLLNDWCETWRIIKQTALIIYTGTDR